MGDIKNLKNQLDSFKIKLGILEEKYKEALKIAEENNIDIDNIDDEIKKRKNKIESLEEKKEKKIKEIEETINAAKKLINEIEGDI